MAARGLDIPEIAFILHYHLPPHEKEFTHRNGRTARMNRDGVAYILHWEGEELPEYIQAIEAESLHVDDLKKASQPAPKKWKTLYITGGRRDKISKGDIVGLFIKQGEVNKDQVGVIEIKQDAAYVGVHAEIAQQLVEKTNNSRLKTKKVRISII